MSGTFTAEIDALDAKGKTLARFTENGNATEAADNSAIFLGINSTSPTIYQIAISVTKAADDQSKGIFAINKFDFRTSALAAATPAARQNSSPLDLTPLASSLIASEQSATPAPLPGPVTSASQPANLTGVLPAFGTLSFTPAAAADAVFAASHPAANDDDAGLFAPLSPGSLDAISYAAWQSQGSVRH